MFKANVDASSDGASLVAALAVVVRDDNGEVIISASSRHEHVTSALHAEILAM